MNRRFASAFALVVVFGIFGCSSRPPVQTVMVPPRFDLAPYQMIGVTEFSTEAKGKLAALATRRFTEMARRDQGVLRMVDLGPSRRALRSSGRPAWTPASYKAVGDANGVQTIFSGELIISNVRPDIDIAGALRSGQVSAHVDAELVVQLVEAETGATLWNSSARASRSLGHISVFRGGDFVFDADDPDQAYGVLVDALVEQVTRDFRATWVRR